VSDRRNLPQQLHGLTLVTLHHQVWARLLTHWLEQIQLLVEPFGSQSNPKLRKLKTAG
jgi:hypothetical protein